MLLKSLLKCLIVTTAIHLVAVSANAQTTAPDDRQALDLYAQGLTYFKASDFSNAAVYFEETIKLHPSAPVEQKAQYWLGNTYFALGDCRKTIEAQEALVNKWPSAERASDAMALIANCQFELGQKDASQKTLAALVSKYPESKAAAAARQKLPPSAIQTIQSQKVARGDSGDIDGAKAKCSDLGYKKNTEQFGNCVLKLTK